MPFSLVAISFSLLIVFIVEFVAPARNRRFRTSFGLPVRAQDDLAKRKAFRTKAVRGALMVPALPHGLYRAMEQSQAWTIATACVLFVYVVFANWRSLLE